ncbi:hypothetical protein [Xanthomonas prunicola]|uniref:hypothetical protein n=1 Tax=Xanthomonas prunicola TaxID=2053930 RepID=UPI0010548961|nr:hypothetical protein [Xanthomonas prunicola]
MKPTDIIKSIKMEGARKSVLMNAARHENQSVRGTAFQLLAQNYPDDEVISLIRNSALDPINFVPIMGSASLAHFCVKLLVNIGSENSRMAAADLIKEWPPDDRKDLEWFLKNG